MVDDGRKSKAMRHDRQAMENFDADGNLIGSQSIHNPLLECQVQCECCGAKEASERQSMEEVTQMLRSN